MTIVEIHDTYGDTDGAPSSSASRRGRLGSGPLLLVASGFEFAVTVGLLTLLGAWLDGRFGAAPLFTLVLALLGLTAATWNLLRRAGAPDQRGRHSNGRHPGDRR